MISMFFSKRNLETVFSDIAILTETLVEQIFWLEDKKPGKKKKKDEKVVQMEGEFISQKNLQHVDIIKPL